VYLEIEQSKIEHLADTNFSSKVVECPAKLRKFFSKNKVKSKQNGHRFFQETPIFATHLHCFRQTLHFISQLSQTWPPWIFSKSCDWTGRDKQETDRNMTEKNEAAPVKTRLCSPQPKTAACCETTQMRGLW